MSSTTATAATVTTTVTAAAAVANLSWAAVKQGRKICGGAPTGAARGREDGRVASAPAGGSGRFWLGPAVVAGPYRCSGGPDAQSVTCAKGEALVQTGMGSEYWLAVYRVVTL